MSAIDDLAAEMSAEANPATAAATLSGLWNLPPGLSVVSARCTRNGGEAIAEVRFSDGTFLELSPVSKFASPTRLQTEIVMCVGATPKLNSRQCIESMRLIRLLASYEPQEKSVSLDEAARDWGVGFLEAATTIEDVDWSDQGARWQAFEALKHNDPGTRSRVDAIPYAKACIVVRALDGIRYVRAGWFQAFVKGTLDSSLSPEHISLRMQRVGWDRPGKHGRIKATRPGMKGSHVWPFFVVPAGWEEATGE